MTLAGSKREGRAGGWWRRAAAFAGLLAAMLAGLTAPAAAQPLRGDVQVVKDNGFTRLVFRFEEEVPATIRLAGAVLVIEFGKPVAVIVDKMGAAAPDYISAARLDPDGTAVRIALARKVKVSNIPAGERLFVDLLPQDWTGMAPGLPQQVIDELARRVREAERQLKAQLLAGKPKLALAVRVKVATQPTFMRYVFELPDLTNVTPRQALDKYVLSFDQPVRFDLADAKATLPGELETIEAKTDADSASVTFQFKGKPELRAFLEERSFVVDVMTGGKPTQRSDAAPQPAKTGAPAIAAPETVPAGAPAAKPQAAVAAPQPVKAAEAAPPKAEPKPQAKTAEPPPPKAPEPSPPPVAQAPAAMRAEASPPKPAESPSPAIKTAEAAPAPKAPAKAPEKPAEKTTERPPDQPPTKPPDKVAESPPVPPAPAAEAVAKDTSELSPALTRAAIDPDGAVTVDLRQQAGLMRLSFPFATPTAAAAFRRDNTLWLVFDSLARIDTSSLKSDDSRLIRGVVVEQQKDGSTVMRLKLERPRLFSFAAEGPVWRLMIGDSITDPTRPLAVARSIVGKGRSSITIPFVEPRSLHRLRDPDVGDTLMVVTALSPARGFLKPQDFVELRALASIHGVALLPLADDLSAELAVDKILVARPGGLSLSTSSIAERDAGNFRPVLFDTQTWGFDREAKFAERQSELIARAAGAPESKRRAARLDLARFYLAREMNVEAKAVLDVTTADEREGEDITGTVLKAVANVMLDRPEEALRELATPRVGNQGDAPIWRAMAHARQGKWAQAREEFRSVESAVSALPIELQRLAMREWLRSSVEVRDFTGASTLLNEFDTLGMTPQLTPSIAILVGRLHEGLGKNEEALNAYRNAANSLDRKAAAQGQLREIALRAKNGELQRRDMTARLELLTTTWRGDETEAEGLQMLAHLYTLERRYRDAFHTMRTALLAHPNSDLTRKIQDEAAVSFDSLFLSAEGDTMPAIEALGLFYDYRELTPIGRRGDEMIRRLADRLIAVDLLDQAGDLLQHQVDHRLQGAARAQVATKLATVYLMNKKPDRALSSIQKSRTSDLSSELRDQRLLLEARSLSEIGRHELALEVIAGLQSREALRLRGDIMWAAKKWRQAAEEIELLYGDRWKQFDPLSPEERADILRAGIAYALAEEPLGLSRFRDKYIAKMSDGPDRRAFEVVTSPAGAGSAEFRTVAAGSAATKTLDAFLREMRARYPERDDGGAQAKAPETKPGANLEPNAEAKVQPAAEKPAVAPAAADKETRATDPEKAASAPANAAAAPAASSAPAAAPLKPDPAPTGSIGLPPERSKLGPAASPLPAKPPAGTPLRAAPTWSSLRGARSQSNF